MLTLSWGGLSLNATIYAARSRKTCGLSARTTGRHLKTATARACGGLRSQRRLLLSGVPLYGASSSYESKCRCTK